MQFLNIHHVFLHLLNPAALFLLSLLGDITETAKGQPEKRD